MTNTFLKDRNIKCAADAKISVVVPCLTEELWQVELTHCIIAIAKANTGVRFELIVSEAGGKDFESHCDLYFHNHKKGFANADMNAGMDLATGDIIVLLTNDVFVKPGWLEAIIDCFDIDDCGYASLGTSDHNEVEQNTITEGVWSPLMAVLNRPDFRFDAETFPSYWGDTDFIMRIYEAGFRAYRNRRVICDHLGRATNTADHPLGKQEEIDDAHERFTQRHQGSPHFIYRALETGLVL